MSNFPTPNETPPTIQQIDATLRSVLDASHSLISVPSNAAALRNSFLQFYSHPTFQLILGLPVLLPPTAALPTNQLSAELKELKSTIQALSKTVASLQPNETGAQAPTPQIPSNTGQPRTQGQGHAKTPPPTNPPKATSTTSPTLILDLGDSSLTDKPADVLVSPFNEYLRQHGYQDISFSAAKWSNKGNLALTAHHTVTHSQLTAHISAIRPHFQAFLQQFGPKMAGHINIASARVNTKWSKILINSVPVMNYDERRPWTPEECHRTLTIHNPSYASLPITQLPSWVRNPTSYKPTDRSSLVVAFEDPDGTRRSSLLASKYLNIFGAKTKITCWKEVPRNQPNTPTPTAIPLPDTPTPSPSPSTPASTSSTRVTRARTRRRVPPKQ
jgi:hypothetical protein